VTNPRTLAGIRHTIEHLGVLTGKEPAAVALAARLKVREDSLCASVPRTRISALLVVSVQPLIVVGRKTFLGELLELAGADNLGERAPGTYPTFSRESVLREDPGVILLLTDAGADSSTLTKTFPEWSCLSAVRAGRVHSVNSDILSRPGPRAVDGLALLITLLHRRP
jgi:iron complex transport system substrate-binding protein